MSPQPGLQLVEVDLDRKEELILAKQLRACRVTILPRSRSESVSKSPTPFSPRSSGSSSQSSTSATSPRVRHEENRFQFSPGATNKSRYSDCYPLPEPEALNLDHLRIVDSQHPPWTLPRQESSPPPPQPRHHHHESSVPPADMRSQMVTNPVVRHVTDMRKCVGAGIQSPTISVSDYDAERMLFDDRPRSNLGAEAEGVHLPFGESALGRRSEINSPNMYADNDSERLEENECHLFGSNTSLKSDSGHSEKGGSYERASDVQIEAFRKEAKSLSPELDRKPAGGNSIGLPFLPFLNDIKALRQPSHEQLTLIDTGQEAEDRVSSQKSVGTLEAGLVANPSRPALPFLNEIRALNWSPSDSKSLQEHVASRTDYSSQSGSVLSSINDAFEVNTQVSHSNSLASSRTIDGHSSHQIDDVDKQTSRLSDDTNLNALALHDTQGHDHHQPQEPEGEPNRGLETASSSDTCRADAGETRTIKKKGRRPEIKITEKSNMTSLANSIIPQLNEMQKNLLGLLFFNELSQSIVDELIAQQVSMMPGNKLASVLLLAKPEACDRAMNVILQNSDSATRASTVVSSLAAMNPGELAETVLSISGPDESLDMVTEMCDMAGVGFKQQLLSKLQASGEE